MNRRRPESISPPPTGADGFHLGGHAGAWTVISAGTSAWPDQYLPRLGDEAQRCTYATRFLLGRSSLDGFSGSSFLCPRFPMVGPRFGADDICRLSSDLGLATASCATNDGVPFPSPDDYRTRWARLGV